MCASHPSYVDSLLLLVASLKFKWLASTRRRYKANRFPHSKASSAASAASQAAVAATAKGPYGPVGAWGGPTGIRCLFLIIFGRSLDPGPCGGHRVSLLKVLRYVKAVSHMGLSAFDPSRNPLGSLQGFFLPISILTTLLRQEFAVGNPQHGALEASRPTSGASLSQGGMWVGIGGGGEERQKPE